MNAGYFRIFVPWFINRLRMKTPLSFATRDGERCTAGRTNLAEPITRHQMCPCNTNSMARHFDHEARLGMQPRTHHRASVPIDHHPSTVQHVNCRFNLLNLARLYRHPLVTFQNNGSKKNGPYGPFCLQSILLDHQVILD